MRTVQSVSLLVAQSVAQVANCTGLIDARPLELGYTGFNQFGQVYHQSHGNELTEESAIPRSIPISFCCSTLFPQGRAALLKLGGEGCQTMRVRTSNREERTGELSAANYCPFTAWRLLSSRAKIVIFLPHQPWKRCAALERQSIGVTRATMKCHSATLRLGFGR